MNSFGGGNSSKADKMKGSTSEYLLLLIAWMLTVTGDLLSGASLFTFSTILMCKLKFPSLNQIHTFLWRLFQGNSIKSESSPVPQHDASADSINRRRSKNNTLQYVVGQMWIVGSHWIIEFQPHTFAQKCCFLLKDLLDFFIYIYKLKNVQFWWWLTLHNWGLQQVQFIYS